MSLYLLCLLILQYFVVSRCTSLSFWKDLLLSILWVLIYQKWNYFLISVSGFSFLVYTKSTNSCMLISYPVPMLSLLVLICFCGIFRSSTLKISCHLQTEKTLFVSCWFKCFYIFFLFNAQPRTFSTILNRDGKNISFFYSWS